MAIRRKHGTVSFLVKDAVGSSLIYLCTVAILLASPVTSQRGFLSIDCGSAKEYIDDTTGIRWETDAKYISTGTNLDGIFVNVSPAQFYNGNNQFTSVRYFDDPRDAHRSDCYILPTQPQLRYLIRLTFYISNWTSSVGISWDDFNFDVYLNSTLVQTIAYFTDNQLIFSENIFSSPGDIINVCLVRNKGTSFISSLEMRELEKGMYINLNESETDDTVYLQGIDRYDIGGSITHRYPDDAYDRWWQPLPASEFSAANSYADVNGSNVLAATPLLAPDLPPVAVMDTTITTFESNSITSPLTVAAEPIYFAAFFQVIDSNASTTDVGGMDILLNNDLIASLNISKQVKEVRFVIPASNTTEMTITFSQASWSRLPPTLNAIDTYLVKRFSPAHTARDDVDAVSALATRIFDLEHPEGEPCLPVSYFWLRCTEDAVEPTVYRVTGLLLDNFNISGSFPEEIFQFKNLSILSLRDNNLDGSIQNLSSLVYLQTLNLENNAFSGKIPSFLGSFPYLTELHLDNNNFSGNIPENLVKSGLNFTSTGNPGLKPSLHPSSRSNTGTVVGGLLGGTAGVIVLLSIIWYFVTRKRRATSKILKAIRDAGSPRHSQDDRESAPSTSMAPIGSPRFGSLPVFSLQQVSNATQRFSHKLGQGSFGPVYYGKLPGSGQEVAAKVKSGFSRQGLTEFRNELELLSRVHHGNLVSLAGYCEEADQQVLIYTYLCNGSLRDHLSGIKSRRPLDWKTRLRIAVDSATGLEYLHFHCRPRIIHRDVKSANILLDKNMVAKVADFGISKPTLEGMTSGVDTRIKGTPGYIDPEYFLTQRLTQKSDVYSFGVVLLEIISGHQPHMARLEDGAVLSLVEWVKTSVREGNVLNIFDPTMAKKFDYQSAKMVLDLALESINPAVISRPDMRQVRQRLIQAAQLEEVENPSEAKPRGDEKTGPSASLSDFEDSPKRLLQDLRSPIPYSHVSNNPTMIDPR